LAGIAIVPVTPPVGAGLTPSDVISVAPNGIPVAETVEGTVMPSGEVALIVGVGVAIPPTCAMAALQTKATGKTAINENLIDILPLEARVLMKFVWRAENRSAVRSEYEGFRYG
jgi:hypothetical protein